MGTGLSCGCTACRVGGGGKELGVQTPILVKGTGAEGLRDLGIRYVKGPTTFSFPSFIIHGIEDSGFLLFFFFPRGNSTRCSECVRGVVTACT
jgi:hypothetical protein